jgi:tetratricopeptide (TPR) repeat protein
VASIAQASLARTVQLQERTIDAAAEVLVENLFTSPSRAKAGEMLATAFDEHASLRRHLLLAKSADQWLQAGLAETDPARARVWFDEALAHAARCRVAMPLRAALETGAITQAMAERGLVPWGAVVDAGEAVLAHDPRHTMTMVRIAESLARMGESGRAAEWAHRALEADESFALDSLRRMPAAARSRCEALVGVSPG